MLKKIKVLATAALFSAGLATVSTPPALAFPDFNFGMNNRGPFMMFRDGPNFWLFNMDNPFGRYGSNNNRGYGFNRYNNNPWNNFSGGGNRFDRFNQFNRWPSSTTPWGGSPWNSGMRPWGGSPWGGSPWSSGMRPWGGSPMGYGMNPMTRFSPFGGFSPF